MSETDLTDGWQPDHRAEFSGHIGPFLEKRENGVRCFGLLADRRHVNDRGVVHGGVLMTFADQSFGEMALDAIQRRLCATIQLNTQFISAVQVGEFIEARGEVVKVTRSLVFARGFLFVGDRHVCAVDGIWKLLYSG
jgi:uncharacterized protein (TIGR00369 family)